jgi:hypothetical protein
MHGEEKSAVSGNEAVFRGSVQSLRLLFFRKGKVAKSVGRIRPASKNNEWPAPESNRPDSVE